LGWLPHALVAGLAIPFIVRQNSWYEWANTLWLLELQTAHVSAHGIPSFFTDAAGSYFYPQQLFYAGPMLGILAYPALVLGPWPVFAAAAAGAFAATSAGISWTARNLGVPPRLAIAPGILFAVTPYTVSNLYGRGDWTELLAMGFLAVALGAATSLLSGRARCEPAALAVLTLAVAGIAGTHNLTLLFGALLAPVLGVALLPLLPGSARLLRRRFALVFAGALTGIAVCGAFLIPNVWLSGRTVTGRYSYLFLTELRGFDRPSVIFDPVLSQPSGSSGTYLHTQTLVAPLIWCVAVIAVAAARRWLPRRAVVTLALLGVSIVSVTLLIADPSWWHSFPHLFTVIQFPFRLVSYLALLTVIVIAVLLAVPALRESRAAIALLLLATAWQIGLAGYLALSAQPRGAKVDPTADNVRASRVPPGFAPGQQIQFRLVTHNPIRPPRQQASVAPIGDDSPSLVALSGSQPVGSLVATRVVASPLIRFAGDVSVAGASEDGLDVLRVNRSPWHATVRPVCNTCVGAITGRAPLALLAGRVASLSGTLVLLGLIAAAFRCPRRIRSSASPC
jgi:hypothetical protein